MIQSSGVSHIEQSSSGVCVREMGRLPSPLPLPLQPKSQICPSPDPGTSFSSHVKSRGEGESERGGDILHQTQMRRIALLHPLPRLLSAQPLHALGATPPRQLTQLGRLLAPQREFPEKWPFDLDVLDLHFQILLGHRRRPRRRGEVETIEPFLSRDGGVR